jgi:hypothetical protein
MPQGCTDSCGQFQLFSVLENRELRQTLKLDIGRWLWLTVSWFSKSNFAQSLLLGYTSLGSNTTDFSRGKKSFWRIKNAAQNHIFKITSHFYWKIINNWKFEGVPSIGLFWYPTIESMKCSLNLYYKWVKV